LKEEQRLGALVALHQVEKSLQQSVLDEWDARCRTSTVRKPANYLFGIIQRAIRGEFHATAGQGRKPPATPPGPSLPLEAPGTRTEPTLVREHVARLRAILRGRRE
jgi:hypothetical protein